MQAATRLRSLRDLLRARPLLADALFATLVFTVVLSLASTVDLTPIPTFGFGWAAALSIAVAVVPIAMRRRWLLAAVVLTDAVLVTAVLADNYWLIIDNGITWCVLTYTAAAHRPALRALAAGVSIWVPVTVAVYLYFYPAQGIDTNESIIGSLINWILASTLFFIGWVMRNRRMKIEELSDRARIAEDTQRALAAQAVADEQRRIARELHDVVAHHISVIGVMSEGAKRVLRTDPEAAEEALTTVNQTARTALREMRDILTVLRQGHDDEASAELEPQPTVDSLRALVSQTKEAGLPVRYTVRGEEYPLPTGVSLAVYRIVQEALTNTIKHAGPKAKAGVVVDYGEGGFRVSIGDSGRGSPLSQDFSGGHGLIGMRERATLYGGSLQAGPKPGGGYLVEARFPKNAHLQGVHP